LWTPYFLGLLADQLGKAGLVQEARATVSKALKHAERSGEGYSQRELNRIEQQLLDQPVENAS
jgi:predicted ATPase